VLAHRAEAEVVPSLLPVEPIAVPATPAAKRTSARSSALRSKKKLKRTVACGECGEPVENGCVCRSAGDGGERGDEMALAESQSLALLLRESTMSVQSASRTRVREVLPAALESECIICFENFAAGDEVTRLGCLCMFHTTCIDLWYRKSAGLDCPTHRE
jgi:hypothetical protein